MSEQLQSLLDKINSEGVKKAQQESERIINEAKSKAGSILEDARREAAEIVKKAGEDAGALQKRAESAIHQASRDILLQLENELKERIMRAAGNAADEALSPEFIASIVRTMAGQMNASSGNEVNVLCGTRDVEKFRNALRNSLGKEPKILAVPGISGGIQLSFREDGVYFDLSKESLLELIAAYSGPQIGAILKNK